MLRANEKENPVNPSVPIVCNNATATTQVRLFTTHLWYSYLSHVLISLTGIFRLTLVTSTRFLGCVQHATKSAGKLASLATAGRIRQSMKQLTGFCNPWSVSDISSKESTSYYLSFILFHCTLKL